MWEPQWRRAGYRDAVASNGVGGKAGDEGDPCCLQQHLALYKDDFA